MLGRILSLPTRLLKAVLAVMALILVYRLLWLPFNLRDTLRSALTSQSEYRVVGLGPRDTFQVTTVVRPELVQYKGVKGAWPFESRLTLQGEYEAKVGFDLDERADISVNPLTLEAVLEVGPPRVLSVELKKYEVLGSNQSVWSAFTPEDQAIILEAMNQRARENASSDDSLSGAVESLSRKVEPLAKGLGGSIRVRLKEPLKAAD